MVIKQLYPPPQKKNHNRTYANNTKNSQTQMPAVDKKVM